MCQQEARSVPGFRLDVGLAEPAGAHETGNAERISAADCVRPKYRVTPNAVDGDRTGATSATSRMRSPASPSRRFVAATHRHRIVFRWQVEFGLTARKTPDLATVALADDAGNEPLVLATLRDLGATARRHGGDRAGRWRPCLRRPAVLRLLFGCCSPSN